MLFECSAIIFIIILTALVLKKSSQPSGYAVGVLPLILLPAAHMLGAKLSFSIGNSLPISHTTAYIAIDLIALMITCILLGVISTQIKKKSTRFSYLTICGGFSTILCCVLLVKTIIL